MQTHPPAHDRRIARRRAEREQAATIRGRDPEPGSYITQAEAREILAQPEAREILKKGANHAD